MSTPAFNTMEGLMDYANARVSDSLPPALAARVDAMTARFDAAVANLPAAPLTVVIFHLALTEETRRVEYVDFQADQGGLDYGPVLKHAFHVARAFNPDCRIIFITGENDDTGFVPPDVVVVRLPLNPAHLMYERVVAAHAYMQSSAYAGHTAFLDSDAFVNRPLAPLFRLPFDVGVTFRNDAGMMKINEGVILAAHRPGLKARTFFNRYLASYEVLRQDPEIIGLYRDIRRWRGGQLSLSAVAHLPGTVSETDSRDVAGAKVRYLPCSLCNFLVRPNEQYAPEVLKRKYIVHLKGSSKSNLDVIENLQLAWLKEYRDRPAAAASPAPAGYIKPMFSLINKEYGKPPFNTPNGRQQFTGLMHGVTQMLGANRPDSGAVAADDMVVWFRNAGFLQQQDFITAFAPHAEDPTLRARIWRIYMLCWGAKSCLRLDGDFMDIGCYDGRTVDVMQRYCNFGKVAGKTWWLYDMFENPPEEARKAGHGPKLFDTVRAMFEPLGGFRVIKGPVPDSFAQGLPDKVAFAQIDLNAAEPEIGTLNAIYDRLVPGGMIIFDDYGFRRHRPTYEAELDYFSRRADIVWESPTGQGLFIKR